MFDWEVKLNPGGQVNDGWTVWPKTWVGLIVCYLFIVIIPWQIWRLQGVWTQLGNQKDPMLPELAKEVPETLLSGKACRQYC